MGQIKGIELKHENIAWHDSREIPSAYDMFELYSGYRESRKMILLIESPNGYPQFTCGVYIQHGDNWGWYNPEFKNGRSFKDDGYKILGWAEFPRITYYLNNQKR